MNEGHLTRTVKRGNVRREPTMRPPWRHTRPYSKSLFRSNERPIVIFLISAIWSAKSPSRTLSDRGTRLKRRRLAWKTSALARCFHGNRENEALKTQ